MRTLSVPADFAAAADLLSRIAAGESGPHEARLRPEILAREVPAPGRIAPYSFALALTVCLPRPAGHLAGDGFDGPEEPEEASGRLVLLHDPRGQEAWEGTSRFVAFLRAPVEPEMAADPMLSAVMWSWLTDALTGSGAPVAALGGTVTVTSSTRFGSLAGTGDSYEAELRCSWTPEGLGADVGSHLVAFADLAAVAAGLPPVVAGVTAFPPVRRR